MSLKIDPNVAYSNLWGKTSDRVTASVVKPNVAITPYDKRFYETQNNLRQDSINAKNTQMIYKEKNIKKPSGINLLSNSYHNQVFH